MEGRGKTTRSLSRPTACCPRGRKTPRTRRAVRPRAHGSLAHATADAVLAHGATTVVASSLAQNSTVVSSSHTHAQHRTCLLDELLEPLDPEVELLLRRRLDTHVAARPHAPQPIIATERDHVTTEQSRPSGGRRRRRDGREAKSTSQRESFEQRAGGRQGEGSGASRSGGALAGCGGGTHRAGWSMTMMSPSAAMLVMSRRYIQPRGFSFSFRDSSCTRRARTRSRRGVVSTRSHRR